MDKNDAINDIGVDHPYTQAYVGVRYSRDPVIRAAVMARAGGVCEYCSNPGFICTNDEPYLECHHIIALAKDGADRKTNVIALCPNDHREAHFGKRRDDLEKDMIRKVKLINLSTAGQAGRGING
jgi:5-methylcytosine-specific restriction endonuclease McrA